MNFPARLLASIVLGVGLAANAADELRIGMIGLDTSHVTAFAALLNDPKSPSRVSGAKVVAAFKGGSPDIESSWSRVEGYTKELREKYGVTIHESIEELCRHVDAVMLESVDGRPHVGRARHALHPPAMERPGLHQEDRGVVVQAGLDDRLEVSLRQQLLAQAVAVVEQLPVRRLPAGPGLDEATQPRLGQGGAQLHGGPKRRRRHPLVSRLGR